MLLREALTSLPDRGAARDVAVATAITTLVVLGGAFYTLRPREAPIPQVPTILIPNPPSLEAATRVLLSGPVDPAPINLAMHELTTYRNLYGVWRASTSRSCPERLLELNRFDASLHAVDPWGTPYQFLCGESYGPFTTRSAGPDRIWDTEDDIAP